MEGAVLLTRQYFKLTGEPKRVGIIAVEGAFHGGSRLAERLRRLEGLGIVGPIRGRGMMPGVPLVEPGADTRPMSRPRVKEIMRRLADAGLLVQRGQSTLTVFPPLTLSEDEAGLLVKILYDVLGKVSESLSVDESLRRGAT